jgi:hypothetical protein
MPNNAPPRMKIWGMQKLDNILGNVRYQRLNHVYF